MPEPPESLFAEKKFDCRGKRQEISNTLWAFGKQKIAHKELFEAQFCGVFLAVVGWEISRSGGFIFFSEFSRLPWGNDPF